MSAMYVENIQFYFSTIFVDADFQAWMAIAFGWIKTFFFSKQNRKGNIKNCYWKMTDVYAITFAESFISMTKTYFDRKSANKPSNVILNCCCFCCCCCGCYCCEHRAKNRLFALCSAFICFVISAWHSLLFAF